MNRHAVITMIALVIIAGSLGYTTMGVLALEDVQVRWNQRSSFDFLTMLNGGIMEICNPSFMQLRLDGVAVIVTYQHDEIGRFVSDRHMIGPNEQVEVAGRGETGGVATRILSSYIDAELSGGDLARINDDMIGVKMEMDTTILGVVPVTIEKQYTGQEFQDMMDDRLGTYTC